MPKATDKKASDKKKAPASGSKSKAKSGAKKPSRSPSPAKAAAAPASMPAPAPAPAPTPAPEPAPVPTPTASPQQQQQQQPGSMFRPYADAFGPLFSPPYGGGGGGGGGLSMLPTAPYYYTATPPPSALTAPASAPALPPLYYGAYAYAHDMTGAYHSRYGSLAAVDAQLMSKREHIIQQMAKVQSTIDAVHTARRGIERETMSDAEAVIHRLRSAEAVKLSVLHHDLETLRHDATSIDTFHAAFARHCPSGGLHAQGGEGLGGAGTEAALAFVTAYPEMSAEGERLASKPLKTNIDVSPDDFERETALRCESLRKFDAMSQLLETRGKMVWKLLSERDSTAADLDTVSRASADELAEWKRLAEALSTRLEAQAMVCAYCATSLSPGTVNSNCTVNTPANAGALRGVAGAGAGAEGPQAQVGSRRHYFVHVAAGGGDGRG